MGTTDYWTTRRINRRRMMQATAATGVGAAAVATVGCGDDDDDAATPGATSAGTAATSAPASPTKAAAKRGGTLRTSVGNFPSQLDPYRSVEATSHSSFTSYIYSSLVQFKGVPIGPDYPSLEVVPDLAKSYEVTDGGQTYTMKLDTKAKWHPPVSRAVVADDIVHSWSRLQGKEGVAVALNRSLLGEVDTLTAIDPATIQFKLKYPSANFLPHLADIFLFQVMPPEADSGGFDPSKTGVGSGPWMVGSLNPPGSYELKRNPDWHLGPERPYLDGVSFTVIGQPATVLAQFKGGNLDGSGVPIGELAGIKSTVPDAQVRGNVPQSAPIMAISGTNPADPWTKDVRVRQAISMAIDRNAIFEALYSPGTIAAAGLPRPEIKWQNYIPAGLGPAWLDPKGSKISAKSKELFEYNPTKAKALLAEAGYPDGLTLDFNYTNGFGANFTLQSELIQQMLNKAGFNAQTKIADIGTEYTPKLLRGQFSGLAMIYYAATSPLDYLTAQFTPESTVNSSKVNDPQVTAKIAELTRNLDAKSRHDGTLQLQDDLDQKMYWVPLVMDAGPNYSATQPGFEGDDDYNVISRGNGAFWRAWTWKS